MTCLICEKSGTKTIHLVEECMYRTGFSTITANANIVLHCLARLMI